MPYRLNKRDGCQQFKGTGMIHGPFQARAIRQAVLIDEIRGIGWRRQK